MTAQQRELISTDLQVMHGQKVQAGTRVPVSVVLGCVAAGMTARADHCRVPGGDRSRYPSGSRLRGGAGPQGTVAARVVRFKLDENLP